MDQNILAEDSKGAFKEKKTRKRLRLSCVECTKRRQKCDRKFPCSLCVTRGVSNLCRWETVPVARPLPARPPANALREASTVDQISLISELKQRISTLENELERRNASYPAVSSGSRALSTSSSSNLTDVGNGGKSPRISGESGNMSGDRFDNPLIPSLTYPDIDHLAYLMEDAIYETTSSVVQIAFAHHGEFIGRGSPICALHSMTSRKLPRFLYAQSTDAIMSGFRESTEKFSSIPFTSSIDELMSNLPSMLVVEVLTTAFFAEVNWRYGIPENWFRRARAQMWMSLQPRQFNGSQLNANWLMLLFTILASAPKFTYEEVKHYPGVRCSDDYFMCAMNARRMVEDEYLSVPNSSLMVSAADGTVLNCLAIPMLCDFLAKRGRVSEAWKLVGLGIRHAEAVGMHRDPEWKLWQMMSADEKLLRRCAWWGLFIAEKAYSYILTRPQILSRHIFDVEIHPNYHPDGSLNIVNFGQNILISLMDLIGEAMNKCFSVEFPNCSKFFEMDDKFLEWQEQLPPQFQINCDPEVLREFSATDLNILARQRYLIHSWYLIARMRLHLTSTTGLGRSPQPPADVKRGRETSILLSIQAIQFQTRAYNSYRQSSSDLLGLTHSGSCWLFEGCFSLFEASIDLITNMAHLEWQEKMAETNTAIDAALHVFSEVTRNEVGKTRETAARAIEVLVAIREQNYLGRMDEDNCPIIKDEPDRIMMDLSVKSLPLQNMANLFDLGEM